MRDEPTGDGKDGFITAPQPGTVAETLQLLSHDIRSAMSDVVGGLRLVDLDRLDPETRLQLDRVRAAGDTLAALVDDALMAAAGDTLIQRAKAEIDLSDWVITVSDRWMGRAKERDGAFSLTTEGGLPERLRMSAVTLDRIVGNLIGNALIHAQGARVEMTLSAAPAEGLAILVRDEGPGYPSEVLARITEGGDIASVGHGAGSGLGLRIVGELTRQIGGTLTFANAPEEGGGMALLHLPDRLVDWEERDDAPCIPPDLSGLRLLVAEDNLTNQTILRQLLSKMRAEVVMVADGAAALDVLETESFDLALIDIEMPRKNGLEVMQAIRAREDAIAQMPIVALTAYVLRDNREAIYAAGADGIIGKPISSGGDFGRAILRHAGQTSGQLDPEDVLEPERVAAC